MRAWQFGKPKTPGFGIGKDFYLSVLASTAVLPPIRLLINPKGEDGAVQGFGVPLAEHADKADLGRPMERGLYALASTDRKTVMRLGVVSKDEAGFDPEEFANSPFALTVGSEALARIRGTWTLCQIFFASHDPMVAPALDFLLLTCKRLAELTEGVVGDSICQRYLLPDQVFSPLRGTVDKPIYAEEHVAIKFRSRPDGVQAYTLGLQKFVLPEFEILNLFDGDEPAAATALLWIAQQVLSGVSVKEGYSVGAPRMMFEVREGGFDKALWEGIPVYELLPPTSTTSSEALRAWEGEILRAG